MNFLKVILVIFGLFICMSSHAQLTTQKKYAVGRTTFTGACSTLDLGDNGILLYSRYGKIIRLNNNYDTVWVKNIPDCFLNQAILNSSNEIIIAGQRNYFPPPPHTPSSQLMYGIQVLKIDLNGNFIASAYRYVGSYGMQSGPYEFLNPGIIEYKPNGYILTAYTFINFPATDFFRMLKLDNNLSVISGKVFSSNVYNPIINLFSKNGLVKKSDNGIIIYPKQYNYFNSGQLNNFLVIDTNLNNTFCKQLNDASRSITSISVSGNDLIIGGIMYSNKLISNQYNTAQFYENSFLLKYNLNAASTFQNQSLLFSSGYAPKNTSYNQPSFHLFNNDIYCTSSGYSTYSNRNNFINDSLSNNFRTRIFKFNSSLQIKWNKRLHIYGTADTSGFQNQNGRNNLYSTQNVLANKNNQLLNFSAHSQSSNTGNTILDEEVGFSLSAIDTSGNNATCNTTNEPLLFKYDSLEVIDKPLINFVPDAITLQPNSQIILDVPLNKITNVCLPLKEPRSKFFWYPLNSYGFDSIVCRNSKLFLYDRSYNEPKTWHWIFPPQANVSLLDSLYLPNVQSISFDQAGVYPVSLVTTNDAGTDTATKYITVINFIPQPYLGNDTSICNGDSVRIIYNDPPNSAHYFYGPGIFTTSDTLVIRDSGRYIIAAYTACGYLYDTINVRVIFKPTAKFGYNVICDNLTVAFTDSSKLNGNPAITYQYAWKPALAPPAAYTNYSTQPNHSFTFAAYDSFDVRLIVRGAANCGVQEDTIVKRIVLKVKPVAACSAINNCGSLQASFTSAATITIGSITQQQYYLGNTLIGTGSTFTYNFAAYGSYTVKQVVKSNFNCISDTFFLPVIIKDKPQVTLTTLRDSVCNNNTYTITANATVNATTISSYLWLKNNVVLANNTNTLTEVNPAGIYNYKLVATSAQGCPSDTVVKTITVVSKPAAAINATNNCGSKSIAITASALVVNDVISNHYIIYGDGNTSVINPNNTSYTYANYGIYTLKYVIQSNIGCASDTVYQTIAVRDKPVVNISYSNNACSNTNYVLNANASVSATTISNYSWFKNGIQLLNNTSTLTENNLSGSYTYKLVASSALGCASDTAMQLVVVDNYPTASFTANNSCIGQPINIANNSNANNSSVTYLWTTSDGQTSNAALPAFVFNSSGSKTIRLKLSSPTGGCVDSTSKTITIDAFPVAAFDITEACISQNIIIRNNSTGTIASYAWQTSDAQQSSSVVPQFIFNTPGNYSIKLEVTTANNCITTLTKTTAIKPPLQLITGPMVDTNVNVNQPLQLSITGADNYTWTPFTNLSSASGSSPVFRSPVAGIFPLTVNATTAQGCKGSASVVIKVFAAGNYLFIPNAFTPDGNGLNDRFNFTCSGLQSLSFFTVYNRYGQIVYQQNTCSNNGWDGTFKGKAQPGGAYVYNWQGVAFNRQLVSGNGTVLLVR